MFPAFSVLSPNLSSGQSGAEVTSPSYSVNGIKGQSVTLSCQYNVLPNNITYYITVRWWKQVDTGYSQPVLTAGPHSSNNQAHDSYINRVTGSSPSGLSTGHSLTFLSVQESDAGEYWCQLMLITYIYGQSSLITLNVIGQYKILQYV